MLGAPSSSPASAQQRRVGWQKKEKSFSGLSKGSDPNRDEIGMEMTGLGSETTKNQQANSSLSGSSVAQSVQLTQLITQLNGFLQQQNSGSVSSKLTFNSFKIDNNFKYANICHNTSKWIIDSGATDHMTWDSTKLENITQNKDPQHVTVANGNKVQIQGVGTTKFLTKKCE